MIALYRYSKKKSQENNETEKNLCTRATCRYTKTLIYTYRNVCTYVYLLHMYKNNTVYIQKKTVRDTYLH